jgi:four helix bundle protein
MAVTHFRDLRCWQLANRLRDEVNAICSMPKVAGDFKFCNSFRDAIGSVCRNISEGFTRGGSREIVQFFTYSLASLAESQDHLEECRIRSVIDKEQFDRAWDLTEHIKATCLNFMKPHEHRCRRRTSRGKQPPLPPDNQG